jgi:hypothetical protein
MYEVVLNVNYYNYIFKFETWQAASTFARDCVDCYVGEEEKRNANLNAILNVIIRKSDNAEDGENNERGVNAEN